MKCIEDEIPFDVPEGWEWCRLTAITFEIFAGGDKPENCSKTQTDAFSIPIFANGIENDGLYGFTNKARVNKSAITVSARGTIGFCCIRYMPFVPIVRLITIVPADGINIEYLRIVFQALIETGEGSSIPQLTVPGIKPKLIPIPPYSEQIRISNQLIETEKIVSAVEINQESVVNYIKLAKSKILDLAIRGKLVPQDPNDEPASVLLEHIRSEKEELIKQGKIKRDKKESIIFKGEDNSYYEIIGKETICIDEDIPYELPDNWEWVRLSSIVQVINGDRGQNYPSKSKLQKTGIPFVSASNIESGTVTNHALLCMTNEQYDALGAGKLTTGDIVYCIRGSLGKCGIFTMEKGAVASSLVIVRPIMGEDFISKYVYNYLNSSLSKSEITKYDNGSAQPNLAAKDFMRFFIPLPPINEQKKINNQIDKLYSCLYQLEANL